MIRGICFPMPNSLCFSLYACSYLADSILVVACARSLSNLPRRASRLMVHYQLYKGANSTLCLEVKCRADAERGQPSDNPSVADRVLTVLSLLTAWARALQP